MKRIFQAAALAVTFSGAGAAQAAPIGLEPVLTPQLTASDVFIENELFFFETFFAQSFDASFTGSTDVFSFTIDVPQAGGGTLDVLDADLLPVFTGSLVASGFSSGRVELLFDSTLDTLGVGSRALVFLESSDIPSSPFTTEFTVFDGIATIAAPIPLPFSGVLLLSGVGGMLLVARRRKLAA